MLRSVLLKEGIGVNKDIMRSVGFGAAVDAVEAGRCPFCGEVVDLTGFRDSLSRKEYLISGLCQKCQDSFFGGER